MRLALVLAAVLLAAGCQREERRFEGSGMGDPAGIKRLGKLQPGAPAPDPRMKSPYEANAFGIAQGQRLFEAMNCTGCHAHGGGAIGPPLMDSEWIYGSDPENIFASIVEGRPNGMPAFRGKLTNEQVWQLVAYVQALSGNVRKDAAPGRQDHMHVKQRELAKETEHPRGQKGQEK